jgi:hypothetical protein
MSQEIQTLKEDVQAHKLKHLLIDTHCDMTDPFMKVALDPEERAEDMRRFNEAVKIFDDELWNPYQAELQDIRAKYIKPDPDCPMEFKIKLSYQPNVVSKLDNNLEYWKDRKALCDKWIPIVEDFRKRHNLPEWKEQR